MCSTVFSTRVVAAINGTTGLAIRMSECVGRRGKAANVSEAVLEDKCWWSWVFVSFTAACCKYQ